VENKQPEVKIAEIDNDVLELLQKDKIDKILGDQKLFNRAMLNAYAELLSEFKKLNEYQDNLLGIVSMLSNEKLQEFFYGVKENYNNEVKRVELKNKLVKKTPKKK
jgi:hypothetical protein